MNTNEQGQAVLARYGDLTMLVASFGEGDAEFVLKVDGGKVFVDGPDGTRVVDGVVTGPGEAVPAAVTDRVVTPTAPATTPTDPVEPRVLGLYCTQDHFNDPSVAYCSVCGISMTQCTRPPEWGPRPQVGVLVTDDGTTHPLVGDLVVGRAPETDESVAAGHAGQLPLSDRMVSRVHARVTLDGWQVSVTDAGSANGTYVLPPGQSSWERLEPGVPTAVRPGAAIALGRHEIRYFSHRNR